MMTSPPKIHEKIRNALSESNLDPFTIKEIKEKYPQIFLMINANKNCVRNKIAGN